MPRILLTEEEKKLRKRAASRKWHKENPDYYIDYLKEYRKHGKGLAISRASVVRYKLKRNYGLTVEQAKEIKKNGCESCGTFEGKLCIDHDHKTDRIRGCLCVRCNIALGQLKESPDKIKGLLAYILRNTK